MRQRCMPRPRTCGEHTQREALHDVAVGFRVCVFTIPNDPLHRPQSLIFSVKPGLPKVGVQADTSRRHKARTRAHCAQLHEVRALAGDEAHWGEVADFGFQGQRMTTEDGVKHWGFISGRTEDRRAAVAVYSCGGSMLRNRVCACVAVAIGVQHFSWHVRGVQRLYLVGRAAVPAVVHPRCTHSCRPPQIECRAAQHGAGSANRRPSCKSCCARRSDI